MNGESKKKLNGLIQRYQSNFHKIVDLSTEIGLTQNEGKTAEINEITHKIEPLIFGVKNSVNLHVEQIVSETILLLIVLFLIQLIIALYLAISFSSSTTKSILSINKSINNLAAREIPQKSEFVEKDEIAQTNSALNQLIDRMSLMSEFASEIGKGNFEKEYIPISSQDFLGNALVGMRENILKSSNEEKIRSWVTEGFAKFGNILRLNNEDFSILADNIISNIVKYLDANQGGIFLINNQDSQNEFLELIACYAWNKKKYIEKRIEKGEGLIGQSWQELDTIYVTDIPADYISITSGLGNANPTSILITPLISNEQIYGVIEIASFHSLEKHQIDFMTKLSENIASTLSTVKNTMATKILLEQTQQQTEEMRAQEEEMRQNMEEMAATQEQLDYQNKVISDKQNEQESIIQSIEKSMFTIEIGVDGNIQNANKNILSLLKYSLSELVNCPFENLTTNDSTQLHDILRGSEGISSMILIDKLGNNHVLNFMSTPFFSSNGSIYKVILFAYSV